MDHGEPGTLIYVNNMAFTDPTIYAVSPVNRDALQNMIANLRQTMFHGAQVPFRVIHIDSTTGQQHEEHIPGCATCSV